VEKLSATPGSTNLGVDQVTGRGLIDVIPKGWKKTPPRHPIHHDGDGYLNVVGYK